MADEAESAEGGSTGRDRAAARLVAAPTLVAADPPPRGPPRRDADTLAAPETVQTIRDLPAGAILAERYRLVRTIGRGGMGSVWAAEHVTLGTPVAIKLIHPDLADREEVRARFLQEARAAAQLRDPHVVQIFDYGVHEGTPYIAMELLEGESLADRLERERRLAPIVTLEILGDVVAAISRAHALGLVHRDLKPDNIFLVAAAAPTGGGEPRGRVHAKILDFGIAKALSSTALETMTHTGAVLGTPFYMSPEQLVHSSVVDHRADLWSLAVIAYECLVGERPFDAGNVAELAVNLWTRPPPIPSARAEVPRAFDAWFARATRMEPDLRFASAESLMVELSRALTSTAIAAATPPLEPRGRGFVRIALGVAALLGIAVAITVAVRLLGPGGGATVVPTEEDDEVVDEAATPQEVSHEAPPAEVRAASNDDAATTSDDAGDETSGSDDTSDDTSDSTSDSTSDGTSESTSDDAGESTSDDAAASTPKKREPKSRQRPRPDASTSDTKGAIFDEDELEY